MHVAKAYVNGEDLKYWDGLLSEGRIDYSKEKIPKMSCLFFTSVKFDDGMFADVKVCSGNPADGDLWSEMIVYNDHGAVEFIGDVSDHLSGEFSVDDYKVVVCDDPFGRLKTSRGELEDIVMRELRNGITDEYVRKISEAIVCGVAEDVVCCADPDEFNDCDVRLAIGRVLLKTLGVSV